MKDRLIGILAALIAMQERDGIRDTGAAKFMEAKTELEDVIRTYQEPAQVEVMQDIDKIIVARLDSLGDKLDGFEDALGLLIEALPESEPEPEPEQAG